MSKFKNKVQEELHRQFYSINTSIQTTLNAISSSFLAVKMLSQEPRSDTAARRMWQTTLPATFVPDCGQEPIAVVGLACRLPGNSNSPTAFWDFLVNGGCAQNEPPSSRFNIKGHYDKSMKPRTMRSPGGMFLENIDPKDIDARFFSLTKADAISMDPQQRQLLEVVYEGLENAGISLETLRSQAYGCFVGSYSSGEPLYCFL